MRQARSRAFLLIMAVALCMVGALCTNAFCRLNLPEIEGEAAIKGSDHRTLKNYFTRVGQEKAKQPLSEEIRMILLNALPGSWRDGCRELMSRWGGTGNDAAISVRVLYAEGGTEEKPFRALLAYTCFSRSPELLQKYRDERVAALVIERNGARLSLLPDRKDCGNCPELTQVQVEKVVRIGGKTVVGLSFKTSNDNHWQQGSGPVVKEERVRFYLVQDRKITQAGYVLKGREENGDAEATPAAATVFSAGVVFKKDLKGNIVGILSPYTVSRDKSKVEKGLIRYRWSAEKEEFVKE